MNTIQAVDVKGIVDNSENIGLLMASDALINLKLLAGKASKIYDLQNRFTGWFSREISSDSLCTSIGGGRLIFKTNPLVVKRVESKGKPSIYADAFAHTYALDNQQ